MVEPEIENETTILDEVVYPAGFAAGLAPIQLSYIAALNGFEAPDPAAPYSFCEIGCGSGRTTIVLAAANPESTFVGIDIAARPVEIGCKLIESAGLTNVELIAADISEIDWATLPDFDFITMHGLFAWVSDDVRQAILRFVDAKLRPGGLVNLSYNALPGWSAVAPIRQYFLDREPHLSGDSTTKAMIILDELENLRKKGASFFTANESAGAVLTAVRRQDPRYVVHEFFSPEWCPLAFKDVANRLASIGLTYVGDSRTIENLPEHSVPPDFYELVSSIEDRIERGVMQDFITNRFFRGDTYQRPIDGAQVPHDPNEILDRHRIGMDRTPAEIGREMKVSGAGLRVEGDAVEVLQQILIHENQPISQILNHPAFVTLDPEALRNAIKVLTIERALVPSARASVDFDVVESAIEPVPALNRLLLGETTQGWIVLACPVTGSGLVLHAMEACLLVALTSSDPIRSALEELDRRGIVLAEGDKTVDSSDRKEVVSGLLQSFATHKLPLLYALGIVSEVA